jgi:hypothetical protein
MPSVTVDIDLDDFDNDDLVNELQERGYTVSQYSNQLTHDDLMLLQQLLDTDLKNWEHTRLRDKITSMIS